MLRRLDSAQFWAALSAAVIALAGFIAVSIGLSPGGKPREPWFVVGIVIAVLGAAMLLLAFVLFVTPRRAELTVVFERSDPECFQDRRDHPQRDSMLRLRAMNTGKVALTQVRSRLKARHDHYGRIRHDNTPPYDRSLNGITLRPGASGYFDIAWCHFDRSQMVLQYADKYLLDEQNIPKTTNTRVEVTFEALREDTNEPIPPITKSYVVGPEGDAITLIEAAQTT